jgi:ketosteroid isomerase-like protein
VSQENVELVRRLEAALNGSPVPDGLLTRDFVMVNTETAVTDKTYQGASGISEWRADIFEAFNDSARFEIEQIVAEGADFIVTMNRIEGGGAKSGAPLVFRWAAVLWLKDGKLARTAGYLRRREALKAVGLKG